MNIEYVVIVVCVIINVVAFIAIAHDKRLSRKGVGTDRVPEGILFFLATAAGAVGIYAGMVIFRHKTKKWYFMLGIPLLILQNITILYIARNLLFM